MTGVEFLARLAAIIAPHGTPCRGSRGCWHRAAPGGARSYPSRASDAMPATPRAPRSPRRPQTRPASPRRTPTAQRRRARARPMRRARFLAEGRRRRRRDHAARHAGKRRRDDRCRPRVRRFPATSSGSRRTSSRSSTGIGCSGACSTRCSRAWTGRRCSAAVSPWTFSNARSVTAGCACVAVITEREPVRRILAHLGMPTDAPPVARARDPTEAETTTSPRPSSPSASRRGSGCWTRRPAGGDAPGGRRAR